MKLRILENPFGVRFGLPIAVSSSASFVLFYFILFYTFFDSLRFSVACIAKPAVKFLRTLNSYLTAVASERPRSTALFLEWATGTFRVPDVPLGSSSECAFNMASSLLARSSLDPTHINNAAANIPKLHVLFCLLQNSFTQVQTCLNRTEHIQGSCISVLTS